MTSSAHLLLEGYFRKPRLTFQEAERNDVMTACEIVCIRGPGNMCSEHAGHYVQVSGVANGLNGSMWVFHRAERLWDGLAYKPDWEHINYEDPIAAETLLQLDRDSGGYCLSCTRFHCLCNPLVTDL